MDDFLREAPVPEIGSQIPPHTTPLQWECRRNDADLICLYDGQRVFTFRGQLDLAAQTYVEKTEDLPYTEFQLLQNKCAATVHRSSPSSIYFTLNDGHLNQTFTFRHSSGPRWIAVPKAKRGGGGVFGLRQRKGFNWHNRRLCRQRLDQFLKFFPE